jgi:hypothetical protein
MLVVAGAFLFYARDLHHGTLAQMGPGYLPRYVAGMLAATGLAVTFRGFRQDGTAPAPIRLRAVLLPILAVVAFGLMIEPLGLLLSAFTSVMIAALASPRHDWLRTTFIAALLAAGSCLLFVTLLDLPLPVLPSVLS